MRLGAGSPTPRRTCARARAWRALYRARVAGSTRWRSPARCALLARRAALRIPARRSCPPATRPPAGCAQLTEAGRARGAFPAGVPRRGARADRARAGADRAAAVRALLPHRGRHRALGARRRASCARAAAARPTRLVCYCLGVTEVDPARSHAAVRALHQRRAQRAARHRHRLRAPAPRRGHPVHLPQVRPPPRRAHRRWSSATGRARRCATWAARWASTCDRIDAVAKSQHWFDGRSISAERLRENGFDPDAPLVPAVGGADAAADRLSAPPEPAPRRLRHRARRPRAPGAGGERRDGRPQRHPVGQGRPRRAGPAQGRHPGAGHAQRDPPRARVRRRQAAARPLRHAGHAAPKTPPPTTCCAAATASACSRSRAARR